MIGLSWVLSAFIGVPPLLGWTSPHGSELFRTGECLISQDLAYTIFSTVGAFYLPLVMIVVVYAKVYRKARDRILKRHFKVAGESNHSARGSSASCCSARKTTVNDDDRTLRMERLKSEVATEAVPLSSSLRNCREAERLRGDDLLQSSRTAEHENMLATGENSYQVPESSVALSTMTLCANRSSIGSSVVDLSKFSRGDGGTVGGAAAEETLRRPSGRSAVALSPASREKTFKRKIEQKRERKAARTLTVVTGTFVCCWLPFFVVATLRPVYGHQFPHLLTSVILWLGYVNSLLNPMIYTLFNPDFRHAFRKILLGKYRC